MKELYGDSLGQDKQLEMTCIIEARCNVVTFLCVSARGRIILPHLIFVMQFVKFVKIHILENQ